MALRVEKMKEGNFFVVKAEYQLRLEIFQCQSASIQSVQLRLASSQLIPSSIFLSFLAFLLFESSGKKKGRLSEKDEKKSKSNILLTANLQQENEVQQLIAFYQLIKQS